MFPVNLASAAAGAITNLQTIVLWLAIAVFAVVCTLLIHSLVRFRRKSTNDPEQRFDGNVTLETIWTIIPLGILVTLVVLTLQTF